jgi:hypothetical protein
MIAPAVVPLRHVTSGGGPQQVIRLLSTNLIDQLLKHYLQDLEGGLEVAITGGTHWGRSVRIKCGL